MNIFEKSCVPETYIQTPRPYAPRTDPTHQRGPLQSLFGEHREQIYSDITVVLDSNNNP